MQKYIAYVLIDDEGTTTCEPHNVTDGEFAAYPRILGVAADLSVHVIKDRWGEPGICILEGKP